LFQIRRESIKDERNPVRKKRRRKRIIVKRRKPRRVLNPLRMIVMKKRSHPDLTVRTRTSQTNVDMLRKKVQMSIK
jgi:hypothetical protein